MKNWMSLLLGFVSGCVLFLTALYFNPMGKAHTVSPLAVVDAQRFEFNYSLNPTHSLLFTNNGNSRVRPFPVKVQELWEPTIGDTEALVTVLHDSENKAVGVGVKFSSLSDESRVLGGKMLVNSVWHLYAKNAGSAFIEQTENQWPYLMGVIIPAKLNSLIKFGDAGEWEGVWFGNMTVGPNALGTAKVTGGTGILSGVSAEAVEFVYAAKFSDASGPIAETAKLTVAVIPTQESD